MTNAKQLRPIHQFIIDVTGGLAVELLKDEYAVTREDYLEVAELIVSRVDAYQGDWPAGSTYLLGLVAELAICCLVEERTHGEAEQPGLRHVLSAVVLEAEKLPSAVAPTPQQHARQQASLAIIRHTAGMLDSYEQVRLLKRS
jgi:hypothetical protein